MRYASRGEVGTATGQCAICPGCNGRLYSRRVALIDDEFIWVHYSADGCEYSYERDFEQCQVGSTSSEVRGRNRNFSRLASSIATARAPMESNEAKLDRLKRDVRSTGCLDRAKECLLHAIKLKPQKSIPGIAAGLKKHLERAGVSVEQVNELNEMTSKVFYDTHEGGSLL